MTHATYYLLDVFTEKKYGGNHLSIFPDARIIDENLFQKIAHELNLSEIVFHLLKCFRSLKVIWKICQFKKFPAETTPCSSL